MPNMDIHYRLRRKKNGAAPAPMDNPTPSATAKAQNQPPSSGKTTPPPLNGKRLQPNAPSRQLQKMSPLRGMFHRSSKRSRDSPPASLPSSPATAVMLIDAFAERPATALSSVSNKTKWEDTAVTKFKIPRFLEMSESQISRKFAELQLLEYKRLQLARENTAPDYQWAHPRNPRILDRYINIRPWQNNRVKLRVPDGHVDYVNASPIVLQPIQRPGHPLREPGCWIAMQGPKKQSINHAWRMVAEQLESPGVIVMLTETHENHMEKCYPYFPRSLEDPPLLINDEDEFGDGFRASVQCVEIEPTPAGDAIELRKLVLRIHAGPKQQPVSMNGDHMPDDGTSEEASTPGATQEEPDFSMLASPMVRDKLDQGDSVVRKLSIVSPVDIVNSLIAPQDDESANAVESRPGSSHGPRTSLQGTPAVPDLGPVIEERIIWHFLYKKWPDFGVPALEDLDSFFTLMRLSREKNARPQNPRIVHCSAGVGRSGTFIALEHLQRELEAGVLEHHDERAAEPQLTLFRTAEEEEVEMGDRKSTDTSYSRSGVVVVEEEEGEDLIFKTVNQLREQRRTMVQADSQFLFIYQVLRKLWQDRYGNDPGTDEPAAKRLEVDPFVG